MSDELARLQAELDETNQVLINTRLTAAATAAKLNSEIAAVRELGRRWQERALGLQTLALSKPDDPVNTPELLRAKAEIYFFALCDLKHALSSDAGRDYIHKADVKPLVEALENYADQSSWHCDGEGDWRVMSSSDIGMVDEPTPWGAKGTFMAGKAARSALTHAREKGLL